MKINMKNVNLNISDNVSLRRSCSRELSGESDLKNDNVMYTDRCGQYYLSRVSKQGNCGW